MKLAVMNVEKGEEIVASLVSRHIAGTGWYKLLAKKKKNGVIEWAHFTERDNGIKENVYRGEVKDDEELRLVMSIMNKHLTRVFGEHAVMMG
jgi:hypothetical protein